MGLFTAITTLCSFENLMTHGVMNNGWVPRKQQIIQIWGNKIIEKTEMMSSEKV